MGDTKIEWTDKSWNPVTGCTKVSPGCAHCYAEAIEKRFKRNKSYLPGEAIIRCHSERLGQPLKWRKPVKIFVNSMSDLFHEEVPFEFIKQVMEVIIDCPQHTFQVLTKRPERMLEYMNKWQSIDTAPDVPGNLWLGVSVENQYWADHRIPLLLQTPAAVRFISYEPALKAVDFSPWLTWCQLCFDLVDAHDDDGWGHKPLTLDQIIMGGESGPKARPMNPEWVLYTRDQSEAAGVPFFFKQWGEWFPRSQWEDNPELELPDDHDAYESNDKRIYHFQTPDGIEVMHRVGKKAAGRLLDGRTWDEFPQIEAQRSLKWLNT